MIEVERHEGDLVILRLAGEVDEGNVAEVRERIVDALPNDVMGAVLDLTRVDFLDSAAVRLIFEIVRAMGQHGQELRVAVTPGSSPGEIIGHVGLSRSVPVDPDPAAALEALRGASAPPG